MARFSRGGVWIGACWSVLVLGSLVGPGVVLGVEASAPGLRIYNTLDRHGRQVVVITNLDAAGNRLAGSPEDDENLLAAGPTEPCGGPVPAHDGPAAGPVEVAPADAGVGGATIVVNIYNAPPEPAVLPDYAVPVPAYYGGLVGPFRYPANYHFLGYGTDVFSPSFFGGLGLNPGNRLGLSSGSPAPRGPRMHARP